jgi:hypothetical protein
MTHRLWSRNSASTRAIPIATQLWNILNNPFIPEKFGINEPGMQSFQHLVGIKHDLAVELWLQARDRAVTSVLELILGPEIARDLLLYEPGREYVHRETLIKLFDEIKRLLPKSTDTIDLDDTSMLNVHKQLAGRILEPWMWHTIVLSGTEFGNFLGLRDHAAAQSEIATIARLIRKARDESEPKPLDYGQWHIPYVDEGEFDDIWDAIRSSVARTAASSYGRQNVKNPEKEFERYEGLREDGHMSPFEHQASPFPRKEWEYIRDTQERGNALNEPFISEKNRGLEYSGNFRGWRQHRKEIPFEADFSARPAA